MKNTKEGVLLDGSDKNIVAGNNIYSSGKFGIHLTAQSGGNVIDYNNVFGSTGYDMNNADGLSPDVNNNSFGQHNNCETSIPSGLCQDNGNNNQDNGNNR
jgi:parallel beta-helix repeat protein